MRGKEQTLETSLSPKALDGSFWMERRGLRVTDKPRSGVRGMIQQKTSKLGGGKEVWQTEGEEEKGGRTILHKTGEREQP